MFGKKTILLAGILCVVTLMLAGCGGSDSGNNTKNNSETPKKKVEVKIPDGYEKYIHATNGYSFGHPKDWTIDKSSKIIKFNSPTKEGDNVKENVTFAVDNLPAGISLNKYFEATIQSIKKDLPSFKDLDIKEIDINGVKAKRMIATYTIDDINFQSLFFYLVNGKKGLSMTGTAVPATFKDFEEEFDKIAGTISLD